MVLGDNVVQAGINWVSDSSEIDDAKRSLSRLNRELTQTTATALGFSEGTDKSTRALSKQATASSGAATSLAGLQTQLASARVAQEAFEDNTGDMNDAMSEMVFNSGAASEAIRQFAENVADAESSSEGFQGVLDRIDTELSDSVADAESSSKRFQGVLDRLDAPEDVEEALKGFDADQMEQFIRTLERIEEHPGIDEGEPFSGEYDPDISGVRKLTEFMDELDEYDTDFVEEMFGGKDPSVDISQEEAQLRQWMEETRLEDTQLLTHNQQRAKQFRGFDESLPLSYFWTKDDAELKEIIGEDRVKEEGVTPGRLRDTIWRQMLEGGDLKQKNLPDEDDIPDAVTPPSSDFEVMPDHLDVEDIRGGGPDDFADVLRSTPMKGAAPLPIAQDMDFDSHEFLPDDLNRFEDVMTTTNIPLDPDEFEDFFTTFSQFDEVPDAMPDNFPISDTMADQLGDNIETFGDLFDPELVESDPVLSGLAEGDFHKQKIEQLLAFKGTDTEDRLQNLRQSVHKLTEATDESSEIMELFADVSDMDDLQELLETDLQEQYRAVRATQFAQDIDTGEGMRAFDSFAGGDEIEDATTRADLSEAIGRITTRNYDDESPLPRLKDMHHEALAEVMGNRIDPEILQGETDFAQTRITPEAVRMGMLQEMVDADEDDERFRIARDVLQHLDRGMLGIESTVFEDRDNILARDIARGLPADMREANVAERIINEFRGTDNTLADYLGDESKANIGDPVGAALRGIDDDFDADRPILRATNAVEEVLNAERERIGFRVAPGFTNAAKATDRKLPRLSWQWSEDQGEYMERLDAVLRDVREKQTDSFVLRGFSTHRMPGLPGDERKRSAGLFGLLSGGFAKALATGELGDGRQDLPTRVRAFNNALNGLADTYKGFLPLLEATSANLGMFNVKIESATLMISKMTAMLGPFVALLGAVATGAVTASLGLASFVGIGAVEYLGQMEDRMAGVNNKQEALAELGKTLKNMAWEALEPLRMARIGGDGRTPMNLFVDMLRGGLILLNRFAGAMAQIAEMDFVQEQLSRLGSILMGTTQDDTFMHQMATVLERTLPLLVGFIEFFVTNFGSAMVTASRVAEALGDALGRLGDNTTSLLGLIIMYGAGFLTVIIETVAVLGDLVTAVTEVLNAFLGVFGVLPILAEDTKQLAFQLGVLVGVLHVFGGIATRIAASIKMIIALQRTWTKLTFAHSAATATLAARLAAAFGAAYVLVETFKFLIGKESIFDNMSTSVKVLTWALTSAYLALKAYSFYQGLNISLTATQASTNASLTAANTALAGSYSTVAGAASTASGALYSVAGASRSALVSLAPLLGLLGGLALLTVGLATVGLVLGDLLNQLGGGEAKVIDFSTAVGKAKGAVAALGGTLAALTGYGALFGVFQGMGALAGIAHVFGSIGTAGVTAFQSITHAASVAGGAVKTFGYALYTSLLPAISILGPVLLFTGGIITLAAVLGDVIGQLTGAEAKLIDISTAAGKAKAVIASLIGVVATLAGYGGLLGVGTGVGALTGMVGVFQVVGNAAIIAGNAIVAFATALYSSLLPALSVLGPLVLFTGGLLTLGAVLGDTIAYLSGAETKFFDLSTAAGKAKAAIAGLAGTLATLTGFGALLGVGTGVGALTGVVGVFQGIAGAIAAIPGVIASSALPAVGAFIGSLTLLVAGLGGLVLVTTDVLQQLAGMEPILFDMTTGVGALKMALTGLISTITFFAGAGGIWGALTGTGALAGIVTGLSTLASYITWAASGMAALATGTAGIVGGIALAIVALLDLIYYLATGESKLAEWFSFLSPIESIWEKIAGLIDWINSMTPIDVFTNPNPVMGGFGGPIGGFARMIGGLQRGLSSTAGAAVKGGSGLLSGTLGASSQIMGGMMSGASTALGFMGRTAGFVDGNGGRTPNKVQNRRRRNGAKVEITNNGWIGNQDLERLVRKKVEQLSNQNIRDGM